MLTNKNSLLNPRKAKREMNRMYLTTGFTVFSIGESFDPQHPQAKYGAVGNKGKGVGMVKSEVLWRIVGNKGKAYDPDNVNEVNSQDAGRQIPRFRLFVSRVCYNKNGEQEHERHAIAWAADPNTI